MNRRILAFGAVVVAVAYANTASAQYVPPGGSPLPVELQYFRQPQGVLDNYNQFVAPRYELANQLRTLDQQQRSDFRTIEKKLQDADQIRNTRAAVTGTSAGFMNYSHYYGARGGARGGRRR